ncbi:hypothetical protein F2Q70_00043415 [Brassica cretica]|uniref:Uncharacterized protein n=1 Tax=Brassica cretica TaxID=69181 RepID=A0A8S9KJL2_BRACR|nr:hypothetical protein F2Q70_00043415 [Brassica cretica]KAF2608558.1 hypothetical protein F2Q68_00044409 [Brassica cretica]
MTRVSSAKLFVKKNLVRKNIDSVVTDFDPNNRCPRDEFHARLTRMDVLFDSLMAVRKKDLALARIEGGLGEIKLLKGQAVPTLDSEETRLLSYKEELMASKGEGEAVERGDGEVAEGGDGDAVLSSDEVEDEGGAPRSA